MNSTAPISGGRVELRYLSVCSGIEAATVAWHPLGWRPAAFSEIEAFPRAVLQHHYPDVPLHGDFTTIGADDYGPIDLLVGGTPCQSFSIAGLRGGLDDERGNLALEFLRLADRKRPRWLVWENVPGVLSSNGGRDFGSILGGMVELGYGIAYRVLDAQHFGVPQRRRRVFVVGYFGDWRRAAAVLFERHSLQGHSPPRREAGQVAPTVPSRSSAGGGLGTDFDCDGGLITFDRQSNGEYGTEPIASTIHARDYKSATDLVAHALRGEGVDASEDGTGRGTPLVPCDPFVLMERGREGGSNLEYRQDGTANAILTPNGGRGGLGVGAIAFNGQMSVPQVDYELSQTLQRKNPQAVAFVQNSRDEVRIFGGDGQTVGALAAEPGMKQQSYIASSAVRRLTPRECERLQGFPDDYTQIPWRGKRGGECPDGPRYKALGNSMAVPVMRWIGERIAAVEALSLPVSAAA
jgi:DNA (cytosine-5)-methyltransferase 1